MDWTTVVMRFALYLDLGLLFGLPFFLLYAFRSEELTSRIAKRYVTVAAMLAGSGLVLSLLQLAVMAKTMTGADSYTELEQHVFGMILTGTEFGVAWGIRMFALLLFLGIAWRGSLTRKGLALLTAGAGIALATLVWAGHAVMNDGMYRYLHLATDIAHLIAAASWIGAIVALLMLTNASLPANSEALTLLSRASSGFAMIGSIIVATLLISGVINYGLIVGFAWPATTYAELLVGKLALFGLMLGLGAANRFHLSPQLERAVQTGNHATAVLALRRSLKVEATAAALILVVVAWLGIQSPSPM